MHELKFSPAFGVKLAQDPADPQTISGYGAAFGNMDSYGDVISPGAFANSIAAHKAAGTRPKMLWQHDPDQPIGQWVDLREDAFGLAIKGKLNTGTTWGKDALASVAAGDVDGLSIGYRVIKSHPDGPLRVLEEIELMEVSVVTFPANGLARIGRIDSKRDLEQILIKSGLSRGAAVRLASGGWPALLQDDEHKSDEPAAADIVAVIEASTQRIRNA